MKTPHAGRNISRRNFLHRSGLASATLCALSTNLGHTADDADQAVKIVPASKGAVPMGKIGKVSLSRMISGGNLLSGWCHQRDLLFVRNLAGAYLTEQKQWQTLRMLEEQGVNCIMIDQMQQDILNKYKKAAGGRMQAIVSVREDWGTWSTGNWEGLKTQIRSAVEKGASLLYLHGGYSDRLVQANNPANLDVIAKGVQFIREQGLPAGLGAHELEVLKACDRHKITPDFYVKTFHHDRYWSATPRDRRKPFSVDGPLSPDHNEFHDNIYCLDPEGTVEFMLEKSVPWIAFKVLAAGAIAPASGFKYAFENGADFIAVGMFDFEVNEDIAALKKSLDGLQRERPWYGNVTT